MLDLIIGGVIAVFALMGWRRGFVKTVFGLVGIVLAFALARAFYPLAADWLYNYAPFREWVYGNVLAQIDESRRGFTEGLSSTLQTTYNLPPIIADFFRNDAVYQMRDSVVGDEAYAALTVTRYVCNAAAGIGVFLAAGIATGILGNILDIASKLPVVNTLNHAGGLAVGLVQGLVLSWVVIAAAVLFFGFGAGKGEGLKNSFFVNNLPGGRTVTELFLNVKIDSIGEK